MTEVFGTEAFVAVAKRDDVIYLKTDVCATLDAFATELFEEIGTVHGISTDVTGSPYIFA